MFYFEAKKNEPNRANGLKEADGILQAAIKAYFDKNMEDIKKELKNEGIPEEEYQEHIDDIRRQVQLETIKLFKNEVKEKIKKIKQRSRQGNIEA